MISGDKRDKAERIAGLLGIDNVLCKVKPSDKSDAVRALQARGKRVCFVDTGYPVGKGKALAVGLLTGLMPCGALSSMWMFAASSGSWKSGAAAMLAFGLGTCVFMLAFGLFGVFIPKKYNKYLVKCSTVLIVALGLILMTKGIKILL